MSFYDDLDKVAALLRQRGRVSYRALVREFGLDDGLLEDLKTELVTVQGLARDEDGRVLVWTGGETSQPAPPAVPADPAERRQITVLFCDLVGSTPLSMRVDPEELRDILRRYQEAAGDVVRRFGGVIARYVGDGLLVYFGYPRAHEDDAARAVRAALAMVAAVARLPVVPSLQVRIGVHTGVAVVGDIGEGQRGEVMAAVGQTPGIAMRLQALAEPGSILVSETTHRLLRDVVVSEPLGAHALGGSAATMEVHRVLATPAGRESADSSRRTTAGPLVGREQEVALLLERWARAREGLGHVVLVTGEAGIGKTRLVQALTEHAAGEPHLRLEGRGSPYHEHSAFHPVIELLRDTFRLAEGTDAEKLARIERTLRDLGLPAAEAMPYLAPLAGLPLPRDAPEPPPSADHRRQRTLETLLTLVLESATRQPVLLVVDDLQWIDPSTFEWLELVVDQAPTVRLLVVLTARPEFRSPWSGRADVTTLTLGRLRQHQTVALVRSVAGGKDLPAAVVEQVVSKTDGVPLFVEELTKMVLESGLLTPAAGGYALARPLPPLAIPATLHDSLMARLDRLATVKAVAQLAAAVGRSFPYGVLHAVADLDHDTLRRALAKLVDGEILYQQGVPPQATFTFRHALIRDAAYQSLLRGTRQHYHARIAAALAAREGDGTPPELIAHHYTEAGLPALAIPAWRRAAEEAARRSAYREVVGHVGRALELVPALPDPGARAQQEIALQLALGPAMMATRGQAAPEVRAAYARARELCHGADDPAEIFAVLRGLWNFHVVHADLGTALELAEQLLILARRRDDTALHVAAHRALGVTAFYCGNLREARRHVARSLELYDAGLHAGHAYLFGEDPAVGCLCFLACVRWLEGEADQALAASEEALARARERRHAPTLAFALNYASRIHLFRRETDAVLATAGELVALAAQHGYEQRLATARLQHAWARVHGGDAAAVDEMRRSLDEYRRTGGEVVRPYFLAILGEALVTAGREDEARTALAEAAAVVEERGERWWEADVHRLRGELAPAGEAERLFLEARAVAQRAGARALDLRAAVSLAGLRQRAGRVADARRALAGAWSAVTEGHATGDLRDARSLLDRLR